MRRQAIFAGILTICLALCASTSLGQAVYGSVFGTVTDEQGNAVSGAKVTVTSLAKGVVNEVTTNESGNYSVTHLVPDDYRVKIEATGFKVYNVPSTPVGADASVHVDAQLQVGALTQTVEVTGEVAQLKTDRSDVSVTFTAQQVENMPLYNRNFTALQLLSPGNAYMVGFQHAASENPQGSQQIQTQGQHFGGTAFQLDGTDNQDPILGIIVINPNLDSVEEVKITQQNYDAEFGKAIGAVVTSQTKSGTNEIHGSAFDFQRSNTNFAKNPFTQATSGVPKGNWNEFGGTLGGPILKNKLFVFGDYQGQRSHVGSTGTDRVPTAAERTGDFSDLASQNIHIFDPYQTSDAAHCNLVLDGSGQPIAQTISQRTQFPGNIIPACRQSPQALALLSQFPLPGGLPPDPNILHDNFAASGSNVLDSNGFDVRTDYSASAKLSIFGRYSLQKFTRSGPGLFGTLLGGNSLPSDLGGFAGTSNVRNDSVAGGFDYTFSPTLTTDFRFGYLRYHVRVLPGGFGTSPATDAGIPGLNVDNTFTSGMPAFEISIPNASDFRFGYNLDQNACNCPLSEDEHQYQFVTNWTKIKGNHSFKFGADVRYAYNLRIPSDRHRSGQLNFDNGITQGNDGSNGAGLAAFLLGYVTHFQRFVSSSFNAYETQPRRFFYAQDTWRVTKKLTINYGLRWDLYIPESVAGKDLGGWVDTLTGEMRVAGENGVNKQGNTETNYKHLSPRLGIAYQANPKTVIRMGYGRSYDIGVFGTTFGHIVTQNLPVLAAQEYSGGSAGAQDINTAFFLSNGPIAFDPASGLGGTLATSNCNKITDPTGFNPVTGVFTADNPQCLGSNGRPMIPDGVSRDIRNFQNTIPSVDAWNVSVQRQLTPTISVTAAYVGNKGTHTHGDGADYNANGPTNVGYFKGCNDTNLGVPNAVCLANNAATPKQRTPYYGSSDAYPFPSVAPYGGNFGWTGGDRKQAADLNSKYNALQITADKRFSNGLSFQSSYTFQHAIQTSFSGVGFARYVNIDPKVNYGPNESYRNHVFILSQVYDLPVGKGKKWASSASPVVNAIIGGWTLNSATTIASGLPWTPGLSDCSASIEQGPCLPDVLGSVKSGTRSGDPKAGGYWYQTTNGVKLDSLGATSGPWGQTATLDGFGNAGIGGFHGPKLFNTQLGVFKAVNIGEKAKAQFQFEAFNVFNHVNLNNPDRCVDCSSGGSITDLTPGAQMRRLQFGLKFSF
jgi:outer membrane receptor protein involved in Fe transport